MSPFDPETSDWSENDPIPVDHPLVSEAVREATVQYDAGKDGMLLCLQTRDGDEWWLFSKEGGLLDIFMPQ